VAGACCAKQTQFQAWRPSGAPSFQYSSIPPFQSDTDCAKQTQFRQRSGAWGTKGVVQTNPIPALMLIRRPAFAGAWIVQNKPNFAGGARRDGACARDAGAIVRNKAKLGWAGVSGGRDAGRTQGKCAKQTQFLPLCRSGDRRSREGKRAKRTQFGPTPRKAAAFGGQRCETKPIPVGPQEGRSPGANRAKRTQFAPERWEGQAFHGQRVMVNWTGKGFRRNKANLPRMARNGHGWPGGEGPRGPIVQNEPNLPSAGGEDHRHSQRPCPCHPSPE
jgi:hypothetical protein